MNIDELMADIKNSARYNSSNLGEFGRFIKIEHLDNILNLHALKWKEFYSPKHVFDSNLTWEEYEKRNPDSTDFHH